MASWAWRAAMMRAVSPSRSRCWSKYRFGSMSSRLSTPSTSPDSARENINSYGSS